jgi:hypothetical protein
MRNLNLQHYFLSINYKAKKMPFAVAKGICGLARTIFEHLHRRFVFIGKAFRVVAFKF